MGALTIRTGGNSLVLTSLVNGAGASQTLYSNAARTLAVALPTDVAQDTTYYAADGPAVVTLTFKTGGVLAHSGPVYIRSEVNVEVNVAPTPAQLAAATAAALVAVQALVFVDGGAP